MKAPLKKVAPEGGEKNGPAIDARHQEAHDIVMGRVEIDTTRIPEFITKIEDYEKYAASIFSYDEAIAAREKKAELKELAKKIEKQKAVHAHLKEKVAVEEAYLTEFSEFQQRWEKKLKKFEEKVEESRREMVDQQKAQMQQALNRIDEKFSEELKDTNNNILNLQRIEATLAKQKNYEEASSTRKHWMKEKEGLALRQQLEVEKKKNDLMAEYELKSKKEVEDFIEKINRMRVNLENERKKELDELIAKYDKIKTQLKTVQESETKKLVNSGKYTGKDLDETQIEQEKKAHVKPKTAKDLLETKKKVLMKKITRLNATNEK